jgi:phage gpG-like protein
VIQITVIGSEESRRRLRKFTLAMSPQTREQSNREAGIAMHSDVVRTFIAQGATDGRPKWEPLKAGGRYVGTGKKLPGGGRAPRRFQTVYQILQDTGALRAAYVPLSDRDVAGVGAASVKGHSDLALAHQYGVPERNLPARPMLPTEEVALDIVSRVYGLAIERAAQP